MNGNYDYQNYGSSQYPEPDYYDMYTVEKIKEAKGVFSRYFLALFAYLIISNAVVLIAQLVMIMIWGTEGTAEILNGNIYIQWLFGVGPMYLIGFPVFYFIIRNMKTASGERKKLSFGDFIIFFLVSEGAMYLGNIIGTALNTFIGGILGREVNNSTAELIENSPILLIIFIVVIVGPIVEELLFRKLMIDRLGRYGDGIAITASAIAFGFFHGNFYQFFYAAMLGFVLGYIYTRTRDVKYTIAMHMLINFLGSILPMLLQDRLDEFNKVLEEIASGNTFNMASFIQNSMIIGSYSILQYAFMIAGIFLFINAVTKHKIKLGKVCEYKIPGNKVFEATALNVGAILFTVFSLLQFALSIFMV